MMSCRSLWRKRWLRVVETVLVDGLCVRSELIPEWCWHCRGLPDQPADGVPVEHVVEVAEDE